jgi:hypothetical protein
MTGHALKAVYFCEHPCRSGILAPKVLLNGKWFMMRTAFTLALSLLVAPVVCINTLTA